MTAAQLLFYALGALAIACALGVVSNTRSHVAASSAFARRSRGRA